MNLRRLIGPILENKRLLSLLRSFESVGRCMMENQNGIYCLTAVHLNSTSPREDFPVTDSFRHQKIHHQEEMKTLQDKVTEHYVSYVIGAPRAIATFLTRIYLASQIRGSFIMYYDRKRKF